MLTWIRSFVEFFSTAVDGRLGSGHLPSSSVAFHVFPTLYDFWLAIVSEVRDHTLDFPDERQHSTS